MRRWLLVLLLLVIMVFVPAAVSAQSDTGLPAQAGWVIEQFDADITVNPDTTVEVRETIVVDFFDLEKHGIYRTIPVKYDTRFGNNLDVRLKLGSVTDASGKPVEVQTSYKGKNVEFRLGDADILVSGKQTYVVNYQVSRVVTTPYEQAELYWNVTGNGWPVPIAAAVATVTAPAGSVLNTICFTGYLYEAETLCDHTHDGTTAYFSATNLAPGEGLTISTQMNREMLTFPGPWQKFWLFIWDNWIYATPFLVLAIMVKLYWTRGRDKQYKSLFHESEGAEPVPLFEKLSVMNIYGPPKDLSPGEVGVLVDEKVDMSDITAVAIDLARRGFFTIKEVEKGTIFKKTDYELSFKGRDEKELKKFEKEVLDMLFGTSRQDTVTLSKPPKSAYIHLDKAQSDLYKHLTEGGFFAGNPKQVRIMYFVIGFVVAAGGAAVTGGLVASLGMGPGGIFAAIMSGLIIMAFAYFMPARTPKGRKALKEVVGLREWIRIGAWREQIHEKHNFLEEVLPYTIAFGLTYKFLSAFKQADFAKLSWYQGSRPLSVMHFSNSMSNFGNSISSGVASTRPKSASSGGSGFSGGGSSGGGFGGGGGGSW